MSALPLESTGEPVDSWTETGMQEGELLSVFRSIASPLSAWLVLSVTSFECVKPEASWSEINHVSLVGQHCLLL